MLAGRFGSIREVAVAPDGSIYATTANQPGSDTRRGDLLIRVIPR
jgi:glucose/arabinose dehydrogenase